MIKSIAKQLRYELAVRDWTQEKFSEVLQEEGHFVSRSMISNYVREGGNVPGKSRIKIFNELFEKYPAE